MGDKTIPDSAEPRLESFYPPFVAGIDLPHEGVVDSYNLCMAISMLKIRRPLGRLIFNMGIVIPGKTVFLIETAPWCIYASLGLSELKPKNHIELGGSNIDYVTVSRSLLIYS